MADRLKLFKMVNPTELVLFDHNPKMLTLSRSAKGSGRSHGSDSEESGGALAAMFHGTNPTQIQVKDAYLKGPETKVMCDNLLNWLAPGGGILGAMTSALTGTKPPTIMCQWGPPAHGFMITTIVTKVMINYLRVDPMGIPLLAKVTVTLQEEPTILNLTNPTSGGRPGRNRHVVVADESLMSIATAKFGNPGAWRAIAEVNDIDDPDAVQPGDIVYLPARDELRTLAEASR